MLFSQDDASQDFNPRAIINDNHQDGPIKKKGKGSFSHLFNNGDGKSNLPSFSLSKQSQDDGEFNLFKLTQDPDSSSSQFSQDFSDRLGQLNFRGSQDNVDTSQMSHMMSDSFNAASCDGFSMPYVNPVSSKPPTAKSKGKQVKSTIQNNKSNVDTAKEIDLQPPVYNSFISVVNPHNEEHFNNLNMMNNFTKKPTKIWISAYKPPSRYLSEFEELFILGEGTFSVVTCCRHRLDGVLYAIKKSKGEISNQKQFLLYLKEVQTLALLQDCPHIIRYYNCWFDNQKLYVQTELCHLGSLEDLISPQPSISSCMNSPQNNSNNNNSNININSIVNENRNRSGSFIAMSQPTYDFSYLSQNEIENTYNSHSYGRENESEGCAGTGTHCIQGISEEAAWVVLETIGKALQFIHDKGLVHLDIRPANIFLTSGDSSGSNNISSSSNNTTADINSVESEAPSPVRPIHTNRYLLLRDQVENDIATGVYVVKLGDFGHCRGKDNSSELLIEGETRYVARELLNYDLSSERHTIDLSKADIFSLGASVYELCLGRYLGGGGSDEGNAEWHNIRDGILNPSIQDNYSIELLQLLLSLMHPEPALRPSGAELVSHCSAVRNAKIKLVALLSQQQQQSSQFIPLSQSLSQTLSQSFSQCSAPSADNNSNLLSICSPYSSAGVISPTTAATSTITNNTTVYQHTKPFFPYNFHNQPVHANGTPTGKGVAASTPLSGKLFPLLCTPSDFSDGNCNNNSSNVNGFMSQSSATSELAYSINNTQQSLVLLDYSIALSEIMKLRKENEDLKKKAVFL